MKLWCIRLPYCRQNFSSEVINLNQTRQHRIRRHIDAKVRFEWIKIRFVQRNFVFLTERFALSKPFSVSAKRDVARSLRSAPRIESSGRIIAQKKFQAPGEDRTHDPLSSTHLAKFSHRGLYADQKGAQGQYSSFPLCNRYQPQLSVRF